MHFAAIWYKHLRACGLPFSERVATTFGRVDFSFADRGCADRITAPLP